MIGKLFVFVALTACAIGAYYRLADARDSIDVLMDLPEDFPPSSVPGIAETVPGTVLRASCEPGRITVFVFYSDSEAGCLSLRRHVRTLADLRPDVAFRMVDLGEHWQGKNYNARFGIWLGGVPHVAIYDTKGRLLAGDHGPDKSGLDLLYDWLKEELKLRVKRRYEGAG